MKRKLFFLLAALLLGLGNASADVWLETDLTSQFNSLATTQWNGSSGPVGWAAPQVTTNSGLTVPAWEKYNSGCNWTGDIMYSSVNGLPAGTYKIELYGAAAFTFGRGFGSTAFTGDFSKDVSDTYSENQAIYHDTGVILYAETSEGTVSEEIPIWYATNFNTSGIATATLYNVIVGEAGSIKIGLRKTSTSTNWHVVQLKGVTATVSGDAAIAVKKAEAEAMQSNVMSNAAHDALTTAIAHTVDIPQTQEAYEAVLEELDAAISLAETSTSAYAHAKAYLDEAAVILDGTNVYTAEAYDANYATPLAKYEAGTLTNEEGYALTKTSTGWHSANTIDDILLSAWTIGGEQCKDYDKALYINTWSVEGVTDGSEFLTPFFEYWVVDNQYLSANTIVATVAGLNPSTTYSFTIRARVRQTDGQTKIANGVTMKVGNGEAVDISAGAKFKDTPFYIGNFTAVGETDADGKLTMTMTVAEDSYISWLSFYNAKWTEGEDLSAYIADYEFALNTAIECRDNAAYAAVTGKERADLVAAITTYSDVDETNKAALIAAKEALEAATGTFVDAAPAYTAFAELNANVAATLGVALPEITSETVAADLDVESIIVEEYNAAESNYAKDYTNKLGEWTNAPGTNSGESWKDGSDSYYDLYNKDDRAMTQTVTLPAGDYALIAKGRGSVNGRLTLVVGDETVTYAHKSSTGRGIATDGTATFDPEATYTNNNNGRGWEYRVMTFTSDGETPVTLTFNWKTSSSNWCGLDDIELRSNPYPLDYTALQAAYDAVVIPTLGFEAGEYAPYNNVENFTYLDIAKNLLENQDADFQAVIDKATADITDMVWIANTEDVEAVYNGNFAEGQGSPAADIQQYGWTRTNGWGQFRNDADAESTSNQTAYYNQPGSLQYGNAGIYTMPLKANTIYTLSFKYASWEDGSNDGMTVSVLNGEDGMAAMTFEANGTKYTEVGAFVTKTLVFATGAAGNYILTLANNGNTVITDVSITKAASQVLTFADDAMPTYAPGVYPAASYSRTIPATSNFGTMCVPFNLTSDENIQYYTVTGVDPINKVLKLETVDNVAAGTPTIFKKKTADATNITVETTDATVVAEPVDVSYGTVTAKGTFKTIVVNEYADKCYYIKANQFWYGNESFNVPAFRGYLALSVSAGARLNIEVDGETAINTLEALDEEQELKDGKYLIDGKIVIVKNGVQYDANGKKLN